MLGKQTMVIAPFLIAFVSYSISASLPFWTSKNAQMAIAVVIGVIANVCWVIISRNVNQNDIPIYGLAYDAMLTLTFLITPYFFIKFNLTFVQIFGILMVLVGLFLTKRW